VVIQNYLCSEHKQIAHHIDYSSPSSMQLILHKYLVSTVGFEEEIVRRYIREQEASD